MQQYYARVVPRLISSFQTRAQGWAKFAGELTKIIQAVIEFAKNINGFSCLDQNDQILLLKRNSFDLVLVILSQFYSVESDSVNVDGSMIPIRQVLSHWSAESNEFRLANDIINCLRDLANFNLTTTETALFSTLVLISKDDFNPIQIQFFHSIQQSLIQHLVHRTSDDSAVNRLMEFLPRFQELSHFHMHCLNAFRHEQLQSPTPVRLPDLYEELFSETVL